MILPFSFLQSWHCTIMCSPFCANLSLNQKNLYFQGRLVSYTLAGAICGAVGSQLKNWLEIEVLGALSFIVFLYLSVSLMLSWWGLNFKWKWSLLKSLKLKTRKLPSFLQGFLSVALPCSLLYQTWGLSLISGSLWGGLLIGLAHAVATMPALWAGTWINSRVAQLKKWRWPLAVTMSGLLIFNLFYFAGRLFFPESEIHSKILFCF